MRKIIIDTDTASDDAVAVMMALLSPDVEVLALTTVSGNIPLEAATQNCLMTAEVCKSGVPVYMGADRPLMRPVIHAHNVHGQDGMSDHGLIHPTRKAEKEHAVDALRRLIREHPGEIELAVIGPATNIALAAMKEPETMKLLKSIWTMGTGGFGRGNVTAVAEFNVFADAEAYDVMLHCGVPVHVVGFDVCKGEAAWNEQDMRRLQALSAGGDFAVTCNDRLMQYGLRRGGFVTVYVCDAVALGCMLWSDMIVEKQDCLAYVCTHEPLTYGQVIFYSPDDQANQREFGAPFGDDMARATVVRAVDAALYKKRQAELLAACK